MITGLIAGAAGLAGSIIGAASASKNAKKARRLIQQQRDDNEQWYNIKASQDYTQRADTQAAINRQRELLSEQYEQARKQNVVAGGSDEALARQQKAANESLSQSTTDIAAAGAAYKDAVEQQYRSQDAALNQQQAATYSQQAAQVAQAAGQVAGAGFNLLGTDMMLDAYKKQKV